MNSDGKNKVYIEKHFFQIIIFKYGVCVCVCVGVRWMFRSRCKCFPNISSPTLFFATRASISVDDIGIISNEITGIIFARIIAPPHTSWKVGGKNILRTCRGPCWGDRASLIPLLYCERSELNNAVDASRQKRFCIEERKL